MLLLRKFRYCICSVDWIATLLSQVFMLVMSLGLINDRLRISLDIQHEFVEYYSLQGSELTSGDSEEIKTDLVLST